jgi:hypothetical protein
MKLCNLFRLITLLGVLLFAAEYAMAANPDTFQIVVACQRTLSVNVTTNTNDGASSYGTAISSAGMYTGTSIIIPTPLYVWNDSPAGAASLQNYSLQVTGNAAYLSGASWATTGSGLADKYTLAASFSAIAQTVVVGDFTTDAVDTVTAVAKSWQSAGAQFSPATAGTRYGTETSHPRNSNLGSADLRLWIGVATPSATTATGANVTFTVTVLAI